MSVPSIKKIDLSHKSPFIKTRLQKSKNEVIKGISPKCNSTGGTSPKKLL